MFGLSAGAVAVWRAGYEPFGKATVDEDPDGDGAMTALNVRLPGQYADAETGWNYNFFRTFDPTTGRYLEPDPIGQWGGVNLYPYAQGDPINAYDPFGLLTWREALQRYASRAGGTFETPFADHDPGLGPTAFPRFSKALADAKAACKCGNASGSSFTDSLGFDVGGAPGRVVLDLGGSIICDEKCNCRFEGSIGIRDDLWNFNPRPWGERDPGRFPYPKEFSTRVGQWIPGVPFTTRFTGRRSVRFGN